jgi:hypothetical protein
MLFTTNAACQRAVAGNGFQGLEHQELEHQEHDPQLCNTTLE